MEKKSEQCDEVASRTSVYCNVSIENGKQCTREGEIWWGRRKGMGGGIARGLALAVVGKRAQEHAWTEEQHRRNDQVERRKRGR